LLFVGFWQRSYDRGKTLAAAEKARSRGRVRKAVRCYLKVLEHDPADHVVRSKLAPLLAKVGRWDEARQNFDKAAAGYLDAGFAPKAIAVWTVAAQTFPEQVDYWERIANEQVKRGKRQDAVLALLQGRSMLRKRRQRPFAVLLLRQVLELEPGHVDATIDLADLLRRDGIRDEAKRLLAGLLVRIGKVRNLRRRVRFAQFRVEPSIRGVLDWALAR
jgi:tetratricopeptide (TPR) repeat protein